MSLIRKLFKRGQAPSPACSQNTAEAPDNPPPSHLTAHSGDDIEQLSLVGLPNGPDEAKACRLLVEALESPRQRHAIDAVALAMHKREMPEAMCLACAQTLVQRGERKRAMAFLERMSDPIALMLKADLLFEQGQVPSAISLLERVLARNIDTPGAAERHKQWCESVSPKTSAPKPNRDTTIAIPSTQQSPYRVRREVARGGAGSVYEAYDDILDRALAWKVYHQVSDRPQIQREVQVAIRLAGPGVICIYDLDLRAGWIAMEWMARGSVREVLGAAGAKGLGEPRKFMRDLARSLARVHSNGWVHADIKPANILLSSVGEPVITDFGVAVRPGEASLGGSASHLSRERIAGDSPVPSDDIYGFGRIIEDALETDRENWQQWLPLAQLCMRPRENRPKNGQELLAMLGG